jgi:rubrerythrin
MASDFSKLMLVEEGEHLVASVYRLLATRFSSDPKAGRLFEQLAGEEVQHALRIGMLRKELMAGKVESITIDVEKLRGRMAEAQALKNRLLEDGVALTLDEALATMKDLEGKFADAHAHIIMSTTNQSLKVFFTKLAANDKAHASLL